MSLTQTKVRVFAFNRETAAPITGGAAAITAKWAKDYGTPTALADVNPVEAEGGFYYFDLTAGERDVVILGEIFPVSSTSGVQVIGVPPFFMKADPTVETKVDTLTSNLSALNGITSAAASTGLAIKATTDTLAARSIPILHVSGSSTKPTFNALHDVRSIAANWTAERSDLIYADSAATTKATIGGPAKAWRDQVNGWLASQTVDVDNLTFEIVDGMPGVVGDGSANSTLDIEDAGENLMRNIPFSYVFIAHKYVDNETQIAFSYSSQGGSFRRVTCSLNGNFNRTAAASRRIDSDALVAALVNPDNAHGVWSIGVYAYEWEIGKLRCRRDNTAYRVADLPSSGNSQDAVAQRRRIHGQVATTPIRGVRGPIGEIVVANPTTQYTADEIDSIVTGMMEKWGVA